jgi:plasmid stabilization system protein ParE
MRQAEYSRLAANDIDAIADHIRRDRPRAAVRFLNAVAKTVVRLLAAPESAARFESDNPELAGMRMTSVRGFKNYLLFYLLSRARRFNLY